MAATAVKAAHGKQVELYREPLTTPGLIPSHLKRATADANPIVEVIQRFLAQVQPGSGATIEKVVALVALYKVIAPVCHYVKECFLHSFTSSISVSEYDPAAQEIIQWVAAEVVNKSYLSTSATVMTGDMGRGAMMPDTFGRYLPPGMPRMLLLSRNGPVNIKQTLGEHRRMDNLTKQPVFLQ
jgi:chaperone BCS1